MDIALLGEMGRDDGVADLLVPNNRLHVIGRWRNPGLDLKAKISGGSYNFIDAIKNFKTDEDYGEAVADYIEAIQPDMFITNLDEALKAGVVDAINNRVKDKRIKELFIPCPDREAAKVEWDKFYLRELINEINPKYNPLNFMAKNSYDVYEAIDFFRSEHKEIAVKPRNLTGGKGVKVQGKHFNTLEEGQDYALSVLEDENQTGVEVQERLIGHEFTLQIFTDGNIMITPPATFDYPYREDGDEGPGTGGMGTFSMKDGLLPFIDEADIDAAMDLMAQLLTKIKERGDDFKGVIYPTFFKTAEGLKIVEVNARGGDPELINVLGLMEEQVDLAEAYKQISNGELNPNSIAYRKLASTMIYLVSPDYGYTEGISYEFGMDLDYISRLGCKVRFAASEQVGPNRYRTVGNSRSVGILALAEEPSLARHRIIARALPAGFKQPIPLEFRSEVAKQRFIDDLYP